MIRVGDSVAGIHMDSELKQRKIGHSDEVDGGKGTGKDLTCTRQEKKFRVSFYCWRI